MFTLAEEFDDITNARQRSIAVVFSGFRKKIGPEMQKRVKRRLPSD